MRNIELIKIGSNEERLPKDAPEWDAVLAPAFGLMFSATHVLEKAAPQPECEAACKKFRLFGHNDWDLVADDEASLIIRRDRRSPAVDTDFFKNIQDDWYWTRTPVVGSSASAWGVDLSYGSVDYGRRGYRGFALAVRRVGQ